MAAASAALHAAALYAGMVLLVPSQYQPVVDRYELDLERPKRARWTVPADERVKATPEPPRRRARLGDAFERARARAADALATSTAQGADGGKRVAAKRDNPLAGDDLDDLRFRPYNHPDRDTPQRIRSQKFTVTPDNRRVTPNPQPHERLLSDRGKGLRRTRDPSRDPRRRSHQARSKAGAKASADAKAQQARASIAQRAPSGQIAQGHRNALGDAGARGARRQQDLPEDGEPRMAHVRPDLAKRQPRVAARRTARAVADRRNRELASKQRVSDVMDMARASGDGDSSGRGRGSRSGRRGDPNGARRGRPLWLNTPDMRYVSYFRKIYSRIQPLWSFPRELEIRMEQGDVLVQFTVEQDGRVSAIRVRKSSGFPKFDKNALAAIQKAQPFPPIPNALGRRLQILAPFEFHNPLIR
ncbi:MAG: TonB C-terminal domain-containing protein [Myxococcales bacterium]|nr:TonB C-terminal domain-containing protein [Myxococcales bacterium]